MRHEFNFGQGAQCAQFPAGHGWKEVNKAISQETKCLERLLSQTLLFSPSICLWRPTIYVSGDLQYVSKYIYIYMYVCVYVCVYVCIYIYIYIYIYIHKKYLETYCKSPETYICINLTSFIYVQRIYLQTPLPQKSCSLSLCIYIYIYIYTYIYIYMYQLQ